MISSKTRNSFRSSLNWLLVVSFLIVLSFGINIMNLSVSLLRLLKYFIRWTCLFLARDLVKIFLETLDFLHSNGIVHRGHSYSFKFDFIPSIYFISISDLKPENLLLASKEDDTNIKIAGETHLDRHLLSHLQSLDFLEMTLQNRFRLCEACIRKTQYGLWDSRLHRPWSLLFVGPEESS